MKGKSVVVTGSTQGIGLAIARAAARAGAEAVLVTGRDAKKGEAAAAVVETEGARAAFVAADLAETHAPDLIFDSARKSAATPSPPPIFCAQASTTLL